jgi:putative polymerase
MLFHRLSDRRAMKSERTFPRAAAFALVVLACSYSALLCLINTKIAHVSNATFAFVDGAIVLAALALAAYGASRWLWILLTALAANFLLLSLVSEPLDLRSIRDPLVLIAFCALGLRWGTAQSATRVFVLIGAIVIGVGLIEFVAPKLYVSVLNVIDFYRARGEVSADSFVHLDSAFFVSSARQDERLLLPFIGPHRTSSIFLEPVSMGNFGALALLLALSLNPKRWRLALVLALISATVIILADARFASMVVVFFLAARLVPLRWSRLALALMPLGAIALLLAFGLSDIGAGDDLATRLAGSGRVLLSMTPEALFGMGDYAITTYDSGYAYALNAFGLPYCILLWGAFVLLPADGEGARYKLLLGVYVAALLCISGTSAFALKTAGLGFFALGALNAAAVRQRVRAPSSGVAPEGALA